MQKIVSILTFSLFSVLAVMLPEVASADEKTNTVVNGTTEDISVVYSTWRDAFDNLPSGYFTAGHVFVPPGESLALQGWTNRPIYFRIKRGDEAIKPSAGTETVSFWVHPLKDFVILSPRLDSAVLRDQLTQMTQPSNELSHEDGFLQYANGSVVNVDSSWVSVSDGGEADPNTGPVAPIPGTPPVVAGSADVAISEIMFASKDGHLPQWVEITNMSTVPVSLMGWRLLIQNDPMDKDVVSGTVSLDLGNVVVGVDKQGRKQSVLVVSKTGRSSGIGTGVGDLRADRIIDVQSQVSPDQARYMLISEMGFKLSLQAPPGTGGIADADVVGNLGMGWELPMAEGNRSSIIRREMGETAEIKGTDTAGWTLASDTLMAFAYHETYYGQASDVGTPGYDAGGPLPVELSKFSAARDRVTGQVVITWETQSELNNAGFFINRSQQKTGQFQVVNPTMIAGAGTTSEKQFYTYTDTTAQPNIVYYYQIEDVSLDGHRQMLTRGIRLKGHVGAAGKATTLWGELKTSHE